MKTVESVFLSCLAAATVQGADFPELVLPQGVGVNIHFTSGHERDLDLIAAAGFKFIRWVLLFSNGVEHELAAWTSAQARLPSAIEMLKQLSARRP